MIHFGWISSMVGGLLISLGCVVPLFRSLFGMECAGWSTFLLTYRPTFITLTIISLTYSYFRYRPSKSSFLGMVILILCLSFSPEILRLDKHSGSINANFDSNLAITHWQIIGMHSESCRSTIIHTLQKIPGIISVNVDLDSGQADLVTRDTIEDDIIIQTVQSAGFQTYKII